ncbi:MAG: hypothetical protein II736_06320 [Clostridia bacterium]|nr:hypothetical protein [Clostridia bacterium]
MSTDNSNVFKKDSLDLYLKELAKEYKKLAGKGMPAEIILIGGAAIIESYGFRDMTTDVDAIITASSVMKDAINHVGDRYGLPIGWLNADFRKTDSYSDQLLLFSKFYKTFSQVLNVRIVTGEYLIAMKLRAFRQYKNDLSDIVGILAEHKNRGDALTLERIDRAVTDLYSSWEGFPIGAKEFIEDAISREGYDKIYDLVRKNEIDAKEQLVEFQDSYPGQLKTENIDSILQNLRNRKSGEDAKEL